MATVLGDMTELGISILYGLVELPWRMTVSILAFLTDLCGTPGYLAPEVLKVSMYDNAPGYGKPVDM